PRPSRPLLAPCTTLFRSTDTLRAATKSSPDRSRMVFYLGDGEQTSSGEPESFKGGAKYVDGGAVLGYGTAEGGPMKKTTGRDGADRKSTRLNSSHVKNSY